MLSNSIMCKVCVTGELLPETQMPSITFFIDVTDHMDT